MLNELNTEGNEFLNKEYQFQVLLSETLLDRKTREVKKRFNQHKVDMVNHAVKFRPASDPNVEGDPFKTLFVAKLSYKITERKLSRELEDFGPMLRIRIVTDKISAIPIFQV